MKTFKIMVNNEELTRLNTLEDVVTFFDEWKLVDTKSTYFDLIDDYEQSKDNFKLDIDSWEEDEENCTDKREWRKNKPTWHYEYYPIPEDCNNDIVVIEVNSKEVDNSKKEVKFSAIWVIIHIILAISTGGITLLMWSIPWVIAKYQTHDEFSPVGVAFFGFLYNVYRLVK